MMDRVKKLIERFRVWTRGDGYDDTKRARKREGVVLACFLAVSAVCLLIVADYGNSPPAVETSARVGSGSAEPVTVRLLNKSTEQLGTNTELVLQFSEPIDAEHLSGALYFNPKTDFSVVTSGNVAVIHLNALKAGTMYLLGIDGERISAAAGRTVSGNHFYFSTMRETPATPVPAAPARPWARLPDSGKTFEVIYDDMPVTMDLKAGSITGNLPVVVHTYAFPTVEKYIEQARILAQYDVDLTFLERIDSTVALIHNGDNSVSIDNPGLGAYILDAVYKDPSTGHETHLKKPFFVTDLAVYVQTGGPETLAWVNSRTTGGPVSGHTVSFLDDNGMELASAVTDERGVAVLIYKDLHNSFADFSNLKEMRVTDPAGAPVYADLTGVLGGESYSSGRERYYSYFYLDRPLYRPTDTINFWGFVKPYHGNREPMPEFVTVTFDEGGLDRRVEARLDAYGCYSGEITLEQIRSSQYGVNVTMALQPLGPGVDPETDPHSGEDSDGRYVHLDYDYVDVKEFQKPAFVISSEIDKTLYGYGENVDVTFNAQFFDGTPLPLYEMEYGVVDRFGEDRILGKVTTDEDGNASVSFPANQFIGSEIDEVPARGWYFARIASDGENIRHVGRYRYFPADTMMKSAITKRDGGGFDLRVDVSRPGGLTAENLERFERLENDYYYYSDSQVFDLFRGEPVDAEIEVEVDIRYVDGLGRYHWRENTATHSLKAENGVATLDVKMPADAAVGKYVYVYAKSVMREAGKEIISRTSYYEGREPDYYDEGTGEGFVPGFSFEVTDSAGGSLLSPYISYLPYNEARVPDKLEMRFGLLHDGEPAENEGRILYTLIQNGVIDQGVVTGRTLTLRERPEYAQTVNVVAAYFDGRDVHPIRDTLLAFDTDSAKLNIDVTPDKTGYRPGETASLAVKVTDKDGNPVQGNVCLGVVDESVFALRDQYIDVVSWMYGDMYFYNSYIKKYTTSLGDIPFPGGMDGGKGDGDNAAFYDSFRSNFKDTAAFIPLRTDAAGNAFAQFVLPDNTTSWRITSVAVGDNLYGGNSKSNIISTLPFFVKPVMSPKYIAGDEIAMLVQGHGPLLDEESDISYSVRVRGDGFDKTLTAEGKAYEAKQLNFGQLPEGEYTVTATAVYSGYSDTVELPLAVIGSNLELVISREIDFAKPLDIEAVRYPVVMSFYDEVNSPYYASISSLLTHYCMIANQRMSRFVAKRSLMKYMDPADIPQHIRTGNESASDMQNPDGGIGWHVGDPSEPELTTKVLLVARDQFDLNSMAGYFREVLGTNPAPNVRASCYLGLAAVGEPVADEIDALLIREGDRLSTAQKAYYIAALAYCEDDGARAKAASLYAADIGPLVKRDGDMCYVTRTTAPNSYLDEQATAAAWIAASKLGLPDADGISLYSAKSPWRIGTLFECMIYVTNFDKEVTPRSFDYTAKGVSHRVDLGLRGQRSISFDKSEFESLTLQNVPDGLRAMAYYIGEPDEAGIEPSDSIDISKDIRPLGDGKYEITLTLSFGDNAHMGQYDISDWIPSNMRLYSVKREDNYHIGHSTEGQKIYFTLYRGGWGGKADKTVKIVYTARKTFDSKAVVDSAYMIHGDSGENCSTARHMLDLE